MAWRFDGQNDYASVADHASLSLAVSGTLGGWAYRDDDTGTSEDYLVTHGAWSASPSWYLSWCQASAVSGRGLKPFIRVEDSGAHTNEMWWTRTAAGERWHHFLITWNAATLTAYLNGLFAGSLSIAALTFPADPSGVMQFGSAAIGSLLPGKMAEWAKWDRVLSAAEIAVLAKGVTPDCLPAGLAWYVPMRKDPVELVRGILVKLIGAIPVDHPPFFKPAPMGWAARAMGVGE